MNLTDIVSKLELKTLTPKNPSIASPEITSAYVSDLLSDVLANAPKNALLVTVQVHANVIAVAVHANLSGVIFAANRRPEKIVIDKAADQGIPLFSSNESAFQVAGRLYTLGLRGP